MPMRLTPADIRALCAHDEEVFVIGAGPPGLTAAYCLTKQGAPDVVIENDPVYVGGISRTVRYKDFLFDVGGDRFFSKSKEVVEAPTGLAAALVVVFLIIRRAGLLPARICSAPQWT
jgi:protoporphyrinogen oxidase